MRRLTSLISSRAARLWLAVVLLLSPASPLLLHAAASPTQTARVTAAASPRLLSGSSVKLETTSTALLPSGTLDATARIRVGAPVDYLQARLQLYRPDGTLLYQKTQYPSETASKTVEFRWERTLSDLGVTPGSYRLVLTVDSGRNGEAAQRVVEKPLLVYDPEHAIVPVAFVVRVASTPMTGPSGRFVVDPGIETTTRDDLTGLADAVNDDPNLRLTVAIAPLALREWRLIAQGYDFEASDGTVTKVPVTAAVPQEYAKALETVTQAMKSGRLELLGQPYSDPSLYALDDAELLGDIGAQYDVGVSAFFTALETTPSAGTAPYDWLVPPASTKRLAAVDAKYVVMDPLCGKTSDGRPTAGPSKIKGAKLRALVIDTPASDAIGSSETSTVVNRVFERQTGFQSKRPFVIGATIEPGGAANVESVLAAAKTVAGLPFTRLTTGSDAASTVSGPQITVVQRRVTDSSPDGYWPAVSEARSWARALAGALKQGDRDADIATSNTLIAESSAWAGSDGTWSEAARGEAFAQAGQKVSEDILGKVSLKVENVTLPGAKGEVPVAIRNKSGRELTVRITAVGKNLQVQGGSTRVVTLKPSENFVTLPVDLKSSIQGQLSIAVVAEPRTLDTSTVTVRASYLDRLAIIGGVVLVLFVLLIFIVRRVRAAEARDAEDARSRRERYTDTVDQPDDESPQD